MLMLMSKCEPALSEWTRQNVGGGGLVYVSVMINTLKNDKLPLQLGLRCEG